MRVVDDSPTWLRDYRSIKTDIDGLHTFAGAIDTEVEQNFQPHTVPLLDAYSKGVPFGWDSPSGDVHAAKMKYHACLTGVSEQLTAYVNASKILVDAVRQVARNYADADALSEAQVKDVETVLTDAVKAAQAAAHGRSHSGSARAI